MRAKKVKIEILNRYFGLIDYKLIEFSPAETERRNGIRPVYHIADNLGKKTGYIVDEELLEINTPVSLTCFWLDKCWIETMDDDAISITVKEENAGVFINFHRQKNTFKNKKNK